MRTDGGIWVLLVVIGLSSPGCRKPPVAVQDLPGRAPTETQEASPPAPSPEPPPPPPPEPKPEPRLLPGSAPLSDREEIRSALERAAELLGAIGERPLDEDEAQQKTAAESFLDQAREALAAGDLTRASVLVDKARILLEDLSPHGE